MMDSQTLFIYLHRDALNHPSWALRNAAGEIIESHDRDASEGFLTHHDHAEVIVFVPGESVTFSEVTLPLTTKSKLLQALPYAVESQLATDIDDTHLVLGQPIDEGVWTVAAVSHAEMAQWMDQLKAWAITPDVLIPSPLLLPDEAGAYSLWVTDSHTLVRLGKERAFVAATAELAHWMKFVMPPERMIVINSAKSLPTFLSHDSISKEVLTLSEALAWKTLVQQFKSNQLFNLLEMQYAPKRKRSQQSKAWREKLRYAGIACLLSFILYPLISYAILRYHLATVNAEIRSIYYRQFPDATSVESPKSKMESKYRALKAGFSDQRLFMLLGSLATVMKHASGITLNAYDYANNQLVLTITATSADHFSKWMDALNEQGLSVKQQSADLAGEVVNATVVIA